MLKYVFFLLLVPIIHANDLLISVRPLNIFFAQFGDVGLVTPSRVGGMYILGEDVTYVLEPIVVIGDQGGYGGSVSILAQNDIYSGFGIGGMFSIYNLYAGENVYDMFARLQWMSHKYSSYYVGLDICLGYGLSSVTEKDSELSHKQGLTYRFGLDIGIPLISNSAKIKSDKEDDSSNDSLSTIAKDDTSEMSDCNLCSAKEYVPAIISIAGFSLLVYILLSLYR